MRRLIAITCSLLLLSSCSDDPDGEASSSTSPAVTGTDAESPDTVVPSTEPTTTVPTVQRPATIDELLSIGRPIVLAHTAGEDEYPASTMFGFGESVEAGVDMLDMNVMLTADGVLVVQHDDDVDRTTNGTGAVGDLTYDEISALDNAYWFTPDCGPCTGRPDDEYVYRGIRTGDRPTPEGYYPEDFTIPRFRDVVARFPDMPLNVEIKGEGDPARAAAEVLAAELEELGRSAATVVASFEDDIVAYFHQLAPDVEISPGLDALTAWVLERTPLPDNMRILQLPPEYSGLDVITGQLVADSVAAGYPIWVWPNDRSLENQVSYFDFLSQGIVGLNINFPAQGVAAVEQFVASSASGSGLAAAPSAGCGVAVPTGSGESTIEFTGAGQDGIYVRHLPPAYDSTTPLPLVLDLHGWSEPAAVHLAFSGLAAYGDDHHFVTLVPDITRPVPRWDTAVDGADIKWIAALLDEAEATLCLDTNRIFVAGMSNGAMMTSAIACSLDERIAAVAPVAGVRDMEGCNPERTVPIIAFHGTDDRFLSFEGGLGPAVADLPNPDGTGTLGTDVIALNGDTPSVPEVMAAWATRNGCTDADPEEVFVADDVARLAWDCPVSGGTVLYRIEGGGHTWPGSEFGARIVDMVGATTPNLSANQMMWQFFLLHPLGAD